MNKLEKTNNLTDKDYYVIVHSLIAYLTFVEGFWNMEYIKEEKEENINLDKLRSIINFLGEQNTIRLQKRYKNG